MPASMQNRQHAVAFIVILVLIEAIGFGIILPVMPQLIMGLADVSLSSASAIGGYLMFTYAAVQFFAAPILGAMGDRFGRRPILIYTLLALSLDYLLMALAPTLLWLFVARFIAGAASSTYSLAYAYITDITEPERRAQRFGMVGAAFGGGFILGPVVGGLLGEFGERIPFYAAAALAMLNFIYGYFVLGESLDMRNRRRFELKRANPVGALKTDRQVPGRPRSGDLLFPVHAGALLTAGHLDLLHHGEILLVGKPDRPFARLRRRLHDPGTGLPDPLGDPRARRVPHRTDRHAGHDGRLLRICDRHIRLAALSLAGCRLDFGLRHSRIAIRDDGTDPSQRPRRIARRAQQPEQYHRDSRPAAHDPALRLLQRAGRGALFPRHALPRGSGPDGAVSAGVCCYRERSKRGSR